MTDFEGVKCRLRPLRLEDISESIKWRNDPETRRSVMGYRFPITEAMEKEWFNDILTDQGGKRVSFAVESRATSKLVGFVHLTNFDWIVRCAEFGITIGPKQERGQGLGSEATCLVLQYAFDALNLKRISLRYISDNETAAHIYNKIGFVVEGRLRAAAYEDGRYCDVVLCSMLCAEWRARLSSGAPSASKGVQ
jgi:RimJ/RimL family protein N-acetyltransferase